MVKSEGGDLNKSNETLKVVETTEIEVDGNNISIDIDDQGVGHYTSPEGIAGDADKERDFENKLNMELGKTLSKAKNTRNKQNRLQETLDQRAQNLGLAWDERTGNYVEISGAAPARKQEHETTTNVDDTAITKAYTQTYDAVMMTKMGVKTQAELEDAKEDYPSKYAAAERDANAKANISSSRLISQQGQQANLSELQRRDRERELLEAVSNNANKLSYNQVKKFAEDKKVDHLNPAMIITLFENSRKINDDGSDKYNNLEKVRSVKSRPITNKRHTKKDITDADVADMSYDELKEYYDQIGG